MISKDIEVNSERWFDLTPLLNEEFRDIEGYEGLYQISNYGRVKSLERIVKKEYHSNRLHKEKILKQNECKAYLYVKLHKNKNKRNFAVHRLVAQAFIPNPDNLPEVDHIKPVLTNKCINYVENLKWCTHDENMGKNKETLKNIKAKPIICYDLILKKEIKFRSVNEASKKLNIDYGCIKARCNGLKYHKNNERYLFKFDINY